MSVFDRHRIFLYQNLLLYAIAFCIPLYPTPVPLLILIFGSLSVFAIFKGYSRAMMSEVSVLLLFFFALHLIGMMYTENQERGWFDLEVKLSLMAFPLAFVGFKFLNTTNFSTTLRLFLYGTLTNGLICLAQSAYKYFYLEALEGKQSYYYFFSSNFSTLLHPSYFALYAIFCILILVFLEWPVFLSKKPLTLVLNMFILCFLSIIVLLTASKIGLIMWFIMAIATTALMIRIFKRKWVPVIGLIVITSILASIFQASPMIRERVMTVLRIARADQVPANSSESTAVRTLIYSSAWELATSQPWYGQGTGDFQDVLDEVYTGKGYIMPLDRHLNAHNQFLQSWISLGIPGLIMVIGIFMVMFQQSFRNQDYLYVGFTTVFLLISMTESTFNVQAGVVFFSFFAVLFARRSLYAANQQ